MSSNIRPTKIHEYHPMAIGVSNETHPESGIPLCKLHFILPPGDEMLVIVLAEQAKDDLRAKLSSGIVTATALP
jgi:hypothetical protein